MAGWARSPYMAEVSQIGRAPADRGGLLDGRRQAQKGELAALAADELQPDRQALGREPARQRDRRGAVTVMREHERSQST